MKITRVAATTIRMAVPSAPYATEGAGTKVHWDGKRSRITPKRPTPLLEQANLVRVEIDDGITGIGEAQADIGFFGESAEQVKIGVEDYLGPQLIGKDSFDREYLAGLSSTTEATRAPKPESTWHSTTSSARRSECQSRFFSAGRTRLVFRSRSRSPAVLPRKWRASASRS